MALPTDIRSLVEEVYHPQSREAHIQVGGEKLADAEAKLREEIVARQTKAKRCCIPPYSADPTGGGSLDDSEEAVQAFTRDGESTTILPFWWDGNQARNLFALPEEPFWNLDAEAPDAGRLAGDLLDQTLSVQGNRSAEPAVANHGWLAWKKRFSNFSEDAGLGGRLVPLPMERVGDQFEGTLVVFGKPRSVVYTREMGLFIQNSQDEEQLP